MKYTPHLMLVAGRKREKWSGCFRSLTTKVQALGSRAFAPMETRMIAPLQIDTRYFSTLVGPERAAELLIRAGLAASQGPLPASIGMIDFWRCCAQNIQLINDESHGIAAGPVPRGSLAVLFTAAKEADDLSGALRRLVDAARLVRHDCALTLSRGQGIMRLTVRTIGSAPVLAHVNGELRSEIYAECFALVTHCALNWMAGRRINPVRVRGAAVLRSIGGDLLQALQAGVARRGNGVSIDYSLADMALPVVAQKYTVWGEAEFASFVAMLEQDNAAPQVNELSQALATFERRQFSQDQLAVDLGLSPATLRRRLAANGVSFRELSANYRIARLKDLLSTDMALVTIAEKLGLSDERSLRRFCVTHLGTAPSAYRIGRMVLSEGSGRRGDRLIMHRNDPHKIR
jgi:AraC-like DNA-binding protein